MAEVAPPQSTQARSENVPATLPFSMAEQFINGDPSKRALLLNPQLSGEESQQAAKALKIAGYRFSQEEIAKATDEFKTWATQKYAQGSLDIDKKTFESIIATLSDPTEIKSDVFDFLKQELTETQLSQLMAGEHPQTIAVIASHLNPEQKNLVLSGLQEDARKALEERIVNAQNADPATLRVAAGAIKSKVEKILSQAAKEPEKTSAQEESSPKSSEGVQKEEQKGIPNEETVVGLQRQLFTTRLESVQLKTDLAKKEALAQSAALLQKRLELAQQENTRLKELLQKTPSNQPTPQQPETPISPNNISSAVPNNEPTPSDTKQVSQVPPSPQSPRRRILGIF